MTGTIRWWSDGAERLFGYTTAEAVGQPMQQLLCAEASDSQGSPVSTSSAHAWNARSRGRTPATFWRTVTPLQNDSGDRLMLYLVCEAPDAPGTQAERAGTEAPGKANVLLVEDNAMVRRSVETTLRSLGYRVVAVASGEACIEAVKRSGDPIDLLITDVVMPEMNGKQLIDQIHTLVPDLPVLFMSGYDRSTLASLKQPVAAEHFLQKPFDCDDLAAAVMGVMAGKNKRP